MVDYITAKIFRYDPDTDQEPYFKEYRVTTDEQMSVLVLLDRIQKELDQTISFRSYCCGLQMCKSCVMKINHKKQFACLTVVKPGEEIIVEPAIYPEHHVKDLVVQGKDTE
jgi:succinate dehydrogenase/fumarate reductase-like Fe-S protein